MKSFEIILGNVEYSWTCNKVTESTKLKLMRATHFKH